MLHLITYDIVSKNTDYDYIIETIRKSFPNHLHAQLSIWFVSSSKSNAEIFDTISHAFSSIDRLFVCGVNGWKGKNLYESNFDKLKGMD